MIFAFLSIVVSCVQVCFLQPFYSVRPSSELKKTNSASFYQCIGFPYMTIIVQILRFLSLLCITIITLRFHALLHQFVNKNTKLVNTFFLYHIGICLSLVNLSSFILFLIPETFIHLHKIMIIQNLPNSLLYNIR